MRHADVHTYVAIIAHTHSKYVTAWAQSGKSIPIYGTTHADYWKSEIPVTNFETAAQANNKAFKTFFHGMLSEGIYIAPSAFETWFLSEALTYEDLDATIAACGRIAPRLT